jgi:uncharacterized protein GlcG (DUF336 family)
MKQSARLFAGILAWTLALSAMALAGERSWRCGGLPTDVQLQQFLQKAAAGIDIDASLGAPGSGVGGLFQGQRMWAAVVNRDGQLCAFTTSTADPRQVWPGSQAIAKAKAYTANAFSLDSFALSTARLYTLVLPGHSLFGLNNSNPFNPHFLAPPSGSGGGLGVSGDTACADHEIAKRVRDLAQLNPPGGPLADDIVYDPTSLFAHPLCVNTVQNGAPVSADEVPLPLP